MCAIVNIVQPFASLSSLSFSFYVSLTLPCWQWTEGAVVLSALEMLSSSVLLAANFEPLKVSSRFIR